MRNARSNAAWASRYPALFEAHPHSWNGVKRDYAVQLTLDLPADDLVVSVRLIAVEDAAVLVCRTAEGWRTLPGGSRERGEALERTAARELGEEAGCAVTGPIVWFASFMVTNSTGPWRDWHPFPVSAWLVGVAPVRRAGSPTNPAGGEHVADVLSLPPAEAIDYLSRFDNGGHADLVSLAADRGLLGGSSRP